MRSHGNISQETAPLGLRLIIESECPELLHTAVAAYSAWNGALPTEDAAPIRIVLTVGEDPSSANADEILVDGPHLSISLKGVTGEADATMRRGSISVPHGLLDNPGGLTAETFDPLVLFLLTRSGRVPLHASAILVRDTAVVFAGRSGSGKSTLALAARRAGLSVLSDDTSFIQLTPRFRVWGFPRSIHVFAKDVPDGETGQMRLRAGRWKQSIPIPPGTPRMAEHAVLFMLERGDRVALQAINVTEAIKQLSEELEPGFDHFRDHLPATVSALAKGGAWRLTLSSDPAEAIHAVQQLLGQDS